MYTYMLNFVVKISMMFVKYFEYYTIILRGAVFSWTRCSYVAVDQRRRTWRLSWERRWTRAACHRRAAPGVEVLQETAVAQVWWSPCRHAQLSPVSINQSTRCDMRQQWQRYDGRHAVTHSFHLYQSINQPIRYETKLCNRQEAASSQFK